MHKQNQKNMEKTIFTVGDRVFDSRSGWGVITKDYCTGEYPIQVNFDDQSIIAYTRSGKLYNNNKDPQLSFTEYNNVTGGFSQTRPKPTVKNTDNIGLLSPEGTKSYCVALGDMRFKAFCVESSQLYCNANLGNTKDSMQELINSHPRYSVILFDTQKELHQWLGE